MLLSPVQRRYAMAVAVAALLLVITACGGTPASQTPPGQGQPESVAGGQTNEASSFGRAAIATQAGPNGEAAGDWPRTVLDAQGTEVVIPAPPQRIHTLSVGYDEITLALVDPARVVAVGRSTVNPAYSNVVELAQRILHHIERDAEQIIAVKPDLVVASPFVNADLLTQLRDAGLTVVVSDLQDSVDMHAENIRLLAHLYGAEAEAERLIAKVEQRLDRIRAVVEEQLATKPRPLVIRLSARGSTPGRYTTMDGIIQHAGGINVAAEAGIERWQSISLEQVVELRPDVIIVGSSEAGEENFQNELLAHPALQQVPAVAEGRVYVLPDRYMSTLSHWNVRGVEELAKLLWPEALGDEVFPDDF